MVVKRDNDDDIFPLTTDADKKFLGVSVIHPMTAVFIALPYSGTNGEIGSYVIFHGNPDVGLRISVRKEGGGSSGVVESPRQIEFGFSLRRVLLYAFAKAYEVKENSLIILGGEASKDAMLRKFGYGYKKSAMGKNHPFMKAFKSLGNLSVDFSDQRINTDLGFFDKTDLVTRIPITIIGYVKHVYKKNYPEYYDELVAELEGVHDNTVCVNPFCAFNMAFPVNFRHVLQTNKKSEFWNVYMFLVDFLPRIPKDKFYMLSYEFLNNVFGRRQTVPRFKYMFQKYVKEVLVFYPEADGKIDFIKEKKRVYFYRAKPMKVT